ncbi:MAG: hypothetical protein ACYC8W_06550 [Candidatus Tyrphobacter sp.]
MPDNQNESPRKRGPSSFPTVVMARVPGRVQGCAINDVIGGEIARTNIRVGYKDVTCSGPRTHPEIVNPDAVGDLYIR